MCYCKRVEPEVVPIYLIFIGDKKKLILIKLVRVDFSFIKKNVFYSYKI